TRRWNNRSTQGCLRSQDSLPGFAPNYRLTLLHWKSLHRPILSEIGRQIQNPNLLEAQLPKCLVSRPNVRTVSPRTTPAVVDQLVVAIQALDLFFQSFQS